MTYTVNDFFCGCGGMGLGLMQAGLDVIWAIDNNKFAITTYKENVNKHGEVEDITQLEANNIPKADVWAFGFPCVDLSVAGKQKGFMFSCDFCGEEFSAITFADLECPFCHTRDNIKPITRSGLFFEVMRLLDQTPKEDRPQVLLAENVKGLKPYIPLIEEEFKIRGYKAHIKLFNSKYWGVPQHRERYFVVGTKEDGFKFPEQNEDEDLVPKLSDFIDDEVDEKYYVKPDVKEIVVQDILKGLKNGAEGYHAVVTPTRIVKRQNGRRAKENEEPMFTLTAMDFHGIYYKDSNEKWQLRKLTPREYGRLQGFPVDSGKWRFVVSDSQAYKQFGNAVTVPIAKAIGEQIIKYLEWVEI